MLNRIFQDVHTTDRNGQNSSYSCETYSPLVDIMARRKAFTISITKYIYMAYIWRLISGETPRATIERFMQGNLKDQFIQMALDVIDRLEASGVEIAISGVIATALLTWFRKAIGSKQLLRLGPLRITV